MRMATIVSLVGFTEKRRLVREIRCSASASTCQRMIVQRLQVWARAADEIRLAKGKGAISKKANNEWRLRRSVIIIANGSNGNIGLGLLASKSLRALPSGQRKLKLNDKKSEI